jgi:transcriptional regulator with XRE-family HTH domain
MNKAWLRWEKLIKRMKKDPEYMAESKATDIAILINKQMKSKNMSVQELAKKARMPEKHVNFILQGDIHLSIYGLCKIAKALEVDLIIDFETTKGEQ